MGGMDEVEVLRRRVQRLERENRCMRSALLAVRSVVRVVDDLSDDAPCGVVDERVEVEQLIDGDVDLVGWLVAEEAG